MDITKLSNQLCIYCYKPAAFTEDNELNKTENEHTIHKQFLKFLFRILNLYDGTLSKAQFTNCCSDCLGILKTFCDLYHQIKCIELKLNWQVDKLLNVIRWADRVPSRLKYFQTTNNFGNKVKFRKDIKRKCKRYLSNSFPRVSMSVFKCAVNPKSENVVIEEIVIDEQEVLSISGADNCSNVRVSHSNKTEYLLLGWISTLSALIFLFHLQAPNHSQIQDESDNVTVQLNDDNLLPVYEALQTSSPLESDHNDNCDDEINSPKYVDDDNEFEQNSNTCSIKIQTIKEKSCDAETSISYFKPPLGVLGEVPVHMPILLPIEDEQGGNIKADNQQNITRESILSILPKSLIASHVKEPSALLIADHAENSPPSSLKRILEAPITSSQKMRLRTKYQCFKCMGTFSDVNRFESHQQYCFSTSKTESDFNSDNDVNYDNHESVEFTTKLETKLKAEFSSSSEDYSDEEHGIQTSSFKAGIRQSSFKRCKVNKTLTGSVYQCTKCTPNLLLNTKLDLRKHEHYKHSNGQVKIDKQNILKTGMKSIQIDGLSITNKFNCFEGKCGKPFLLRQDLDNHKKLHNKFTCSVCDFTANYALKLIDHELEHSDKKQKLTNPNFNMGEIYACAQCNYENQSKKPLINHYLVEHLNLPEIKTKCPICQQEFLYIDRVSLVHFVNCHDINRLDNPDEKVICTEPDCSAYFLTEDQLHVHWNRQHVSGCTSYESNVLMEHKIAKRKKQLDTEKKIDKIFNCSYCTKTFVHRGDFRSHVIRSHAKKMGLKHVEGTRGNYVISKEGLTINDVVLEQNATHFCKVGECKEKFREEEDFNRHSKLHGEFVCKFCKVVKSFAVDLAIHETIHVAENDKKAYDKRSKLRLRLFKCSRCPYKVGLIKRYLEHFVSKHLDLKIDQKRCPICEYGFETDTYKKPIMINALKKAVHKHYMDWHDFTDVEGGEKKNAEKCDKCPSYFKTKLQLLFYSVDVHNPDKSKCEGVWSNECCDCGKKFGNVTGLRHHRKLSHKVECKFECEVEGCPKKFENVKELMHHDILNHSTKEVFICSECGKSFFNNSSLSSHMHTHEKKVKIIKKLHVCEKCGKSFQDKPKLKQHYRFHEGSESWEFECEICKKKLSSKQKLNEHMRTHTKEKPFVCQVCGVAYAHRHNLRNHVNSKHKEVEDVGSKRVGTNFASWRKGKKLK